MHICADLELKRSYLDKCVHEHDADTNQPCVNLSSRQVGVSLKGRLDSPSYLNVPLSQ